MKRNPTIRDVARLAGVSHQTVSRVINDNERVAPETRARIEAAIAELGYSPNAIARSMAQGRTFTLACISQNLTDYTFASIIEGAETEARLQNYYLLTSSADTAEELLSLLEPLVGQRRVDAMMIVHPYIDPHIVPLPTTIPMVFVGSHKRAGSHHSVYLDNYASSCIATRHMLEQGHRVVAHITGPLVEEAAIDRKRGYEDTLRAAGFAVLEDLCVEGDWSASTGYTGFQRLYAAHPDVTAIVAQNDRMAIGVIRAVRDAGLDVPGQISVIGFDDMPLASYFDPPLTTMRQDMFEIGRTAARLIIHAVENGVVEQAHIRLSPAQLIVRNSTTHAPRGGDR